MDYQPQFTLRDLYISPFSGRRKYDEEGYIRYEPVSRNTEPSGIRVLDHYLQFLLRGGYYRPGFCKREGITPAQLSALVSVLTGYSIMEFQRRYVLMIIDDVMRYTKLSIDYIARRFGAVDGTNLNRLYHRMYKCTPRERQLQLRQRNDAGRYKIV